MFEIFIVKKEAGPRRSRNHSSRLWGLLEIAMSLLMFTLAESAAVEATFNLFATFCAGLKLSGLHAL